MNNEQENILRQIQKSIRVTRKELDIMFERKQKLEKLSDQFYTAYQDGLWETCNIQLTQLYDEMVKKFGVLFKLQTLILKANLGENVSLNLINPEKSTS